MVADEASSRNWVPMSCRDSKSLCWEDFSVRVEHLLLQVSCGSKVFVQLPWGLCFRTSHKASVYVSTRVGASFEGSREDTSVPESMSHPRDLVPGPLSVSLTDLVFH